MNKLNCVNIGCGASPIKGWVNYDSSFFVLLGGVPLIRGVIKKLFFSNKGIKELMIKTELCGIRYADAGKHIPERNGSVVVLYSSHMLEHLDKEEATNFLKEAYRVLAPKGIIRLVVPDIRNLVDRYLKHGDADKFIGDTALVAAKPKKFIKKIQYLVIGHGWHHRMYDFVLLQKLLTSFGFIEIKEFKAGGTMIPDTSDMDLEAHKWCSLYVEAIKP